MPIGASLLYALVNLLHGRMLWLMIWPVLVAVLLWGGVLIVFWARLVAKLVSLIQGLLERSEFIAQFDLSDGLALASKAALLLVLVPLVQFTALLILGVFGMSSIVAHVSLDRYSGLERQGGGGMWGSAANGMLALVGFLGLGLLSLPLWLFPPLWPILAVATFGWMNQRVLRYDALAEHASPPEMRELFRQERLGLYVLGVLLALLAYVPLVGLIAPVLFGLAFTHYLLGRLDRLREKPVDGGVVRPRRRGLSGPSGQ